MIYVTRPQLPDRERLYAYLDGICQRQWFANDGQLVRELTDRLEQYLGVENLLLVANGTLALQIAYRAVSLTPPIQGGSNHVVTSPFSFIATASSLKWEGMQPRFVDIDLNTWCMDPKKLEAAITQETRGIVPVHVFGNACDVDAIEEIARKHDLPVVYDASHAFGVRYGEKSLLDHGDAATLSFHATKLFHTGEGGAIVFKRRENLDRARRHINFGITGPECVEQLGINAKMSEMQAALGLCVLDEMESHMESRRHIWNRYNEALQGSIQTQTLNEPLDYNYSYFPAAFQNAEQMTKIDSALKANDILARRYFAPSLDTLECLDDTRAQPLSRDLAGRILCLPIYASLQHAEQAKVISVIQGSLQG